MDSFKNFLRLIVDPSSLLETAVNSELVQQALTSFVPPNDLIRVTQSSLRITVAHLGRLGSDNADLQAIMVDLRHHIETTFTLDSIELRNLSTFLLFNASEEVSAITSDCIESATSTPYPKDSIALIFEQFPKHLQSHFSRLLSEPKAQQAATQANNTLLLQILAQVRQLSANSRNPNEIPISQFSPSDQDSHHSKDISNKILRPEQHNSQKFEYVQEAASFKTMSGNTEMQLSVLPQRERDIVQLLRTKHMSLNHSESNEATTKLEMQSQLDGEKKRETGGISHVSNDHKFHHGNLLDHVKQTCTEAYHLLSLSVHASEQGKDTQAVENAYLAELLYPEIKISSFYLAKAMLDLAPAGLSQTLTDAQSRFERLLADATFLSLDQSLEPTLRCYLAMCFLNSELNIQLQAAEREIKLAQTLYEDQGNQVGRAFCALLMSRVYGGQRSTKLLLNNQLELQQMALVPAAKELDSEHFRHLQNWVVGEKLIRSPGKNRHSQIAQGIDELKVALQYFVFEKFPYENANIHRCIGEGYLAFGEFPQNTRLKEAEYHLNEALQRSPMQNQEQRIQVAAILNSLGICSRRLAKLEGCDSLMKSLAQLRESLNLLNRENSSLRYAMTLMNIGNTYAELVRFGDHHYLSYSLHFYRQSLIIHKSRCDAIDCARVLSNAAAILQWSSQTSTKTLTNRAIPWCCEALTVLSETQSPLEWSNATSILGKCLQRVYGGDAGLDLLSRSLDVRRELRQGLQSDSKLAVIWNLVSPPTFMLMSAKLELTKRRTH